MNTAGDFANRLKLVIEQEVKWCKENPDAHLKQDFMDGFVSGLQQAIFLLEKAKEVKSE